MVKNSKLTLTVPDSVRYGEEPWVSEVETHSISYCRGWSFKGVTVCAPKEIIDALATELGNAGIALEITMTTEEILGVAFKSSVAPEPMRNLVVKFVDDAWKQFQADHGLG